ncbi:MAG TPA: hypothetical protein VGC18_04425 [Lacisediminihabitans sp.]|uniref:hypothetical protein n=1 Tax=Lacisediminihabitans sp. TaxID=2787631 RepID=UPI002ED898B8
MVITAETLLAGPRGRRLCLEYARTAAGAGGELQDVGRAFAIAVFEAGYDLDPGSGRSRILIGTRGPEVERPHYSAEDVAVLLGRLPLPTPNERTLLEALATVVDAARYWQEPDGEDVLAAGPVMEEALTRVAAQIAVSPAAGWWPEPLARHRQWAVRWEDRGGDGTPLEDRAMGAAARLAAWSEATMHDEDRSTRERPTDPTAAYSGAWWSKPPTALTHTTRDLGSLGPAGLWLVEDGLGWAGAVVGRVTAPQDARVYEIEDAAAWVRLCRSYPLEVTASRRHDWYRVTGRIGDWVIPDWERVARDFDAVHLTVAAYLSTAGRAAVIDDATASVIAGWNPDETYWLTDPTGTADEAPSGQVWWRDGRQRWVPAATGR